MLSIITPAFSAHPQLLMDTTELSFIRAKVANNTVDWQALRSQCDTLAGSAVQWPDPLNGGGSRKRGYVFNPPNATGTIYSGFNGSEFYDVMVKLGACYLALEPTDSAKAAKYLAQAHNVITALAQPPLILTRQSDNAVRYAASVDKYGADLTAGVPMSALMFFTTPPGGVYSSPSVKVSVGETWAISGAQGCTNMNGVWKVGSIVGNVINFANPDGTPAPALNANCTLYSVDPMASSYPLRFWVPACAIAYDWFYDGLTDKEKSNLKSCMNAWMYELAVTGLHYGPGDNFFFGNFWALTAAYVATDDGANIGTYDGTHSWDSFYASRIKNELTGPHLFRDYWEQWLSGGGGPEGWQFYGFNAARNVFDAMLAAKMHGIDWSQPPYNFPFVDDNLRYWMQFTSPSKLELDDNEYVYPIATSYPTGIGYGGGSYNGKWFPSATVYIPLTHAAMFNMTARRFGSSYATKFQGWYRTVMAKEQAAAGVSIPAWSKTTARAKGVNALYTSEPLPVDIFLYDDPSAPASDWKTLPLMYRGWSGNYAVTRSDWSDSAVEVTLLGGPSIGNAGNGKTQFNSGAITIRRGNPARKNDDHLVVYGLGEAARDGDIINLASFHSLFNERGSYGNKKNSIFWADASPSGTRNQGLLARITPPGQSHITAPSGSHIDRAYDDANYTYWRAIGLEANNSKSTIDGKWHQTSWTREVFFLRPKLVVVHDRTAVLNTTDYRAMFWNFGRNLSEVTINIPAGMRRYDASYRGTYRGAFWSVLPASSSVVSVDHKNLGYLFRLEVSPSVSDHLNDNWLAVFDAATSPSLVNAVTAPAATNIDAVQFNDAQHTVVGFPQSYPPTLPMSIALNGNAHVYVAGLNASTNYKVTVTNTAVTIASDDGSQRMASSEAGVLAFVCP
jgi:hypothetical protein